MRTRNDFPPGTKVICKSDGKWGIVVSEKVAQDYDNSCGFNEERRLSRVWVEWFSISTIKDRGVILHTSADGLEKAGVDVRAALKAS